MPTRDRCAYLRRAIESLQRQSYPRWEAVIVDDGSVDETPAVLSGIGEERVKAIRGGGAGTCAARNLALASAKGELIAYLDDDNMMHPHWLKTVAWAFAQHPEADVLYGAFIVDDPARINPLDRGQLPQMFFYPYDPKAVAADNIADMGCIAHRAGLPEARFDQALACGLFEHLADGAALALLAEVRRVLVPGGRLLVIAELPAADRLGRLRQAVLGPVSRRPEGYRRLLEEAGPLGRLDAFRSGLTDCVAAHVRTRDSVPRG